MSHLSRQGENHGRRNSGQVHSLSRLVEARGLIDCGFRLAYQTREKGNQMNEELIILAGVLVGFAVMFWAGVLSERHRRPDLGKLKASTRKLTRQNEKLSAAFSLAYAALHDSRSKAMFIKENPAWAAHYEFLDEQMEKIVGILNGPDHN